MGPGNEPLPHGGEQLVDMGRNGILALRLLEGVLVPPRHRFVEKSQVVSRFDVVAERLQRPHDDVAMAVTVPDLSVRLEHEPLRPVATRFVLLREHDPQDLLDGLIVLEREEELDRSLAYVARPPCSTGILLQAVRHGEVHHRVVRKPWKDGVERRDARDFDR